MYYSIFSQVSLRSIPFRTPGVQGISFILWTRSGEARQGKARQMLCEGRLLSLSCKVSGFSFASFLFLFYFPIYKHVENRGEGKERRAYMLSDISTKGKLDVDFFIFFPIFKVQSHAKQNWKLGGSRVQVTGRIWGVHKFGNSPWERERECMYPRQNRQSRQSRETDRQTERETHRCMLIQSKGPKKGQIWKYFLLFLFLFLCCFKQLPMQNLAFKWLFDMPFIYSKQAKAMIMA